MLNTKDDKTMILLKCAICGSKKSRFFKNQEPGELWSSLSKTCEDIIKHCHNDLIALMAILLY